MKLLRSLFGCCLLLAVVVPSRPAHTQATGPVLVVPAFTMPTNSAWPWNLMELHDQVVKKLQEKFGSEVKVVAVAPADATKIYTLNLEMTRFWQENESSNVAGGIQQSIQNGEAHSWMTDANGKKLFDKKDAFHSASEGSYAQVDHESSGPMAKDIVSEVVAHVSGAKIFTGK